jgi:hypothetical protein
MNMLGMVLHVLTHSHHLLLKLLDKFGLLLSAAYLNKIL